MSDPKPDAPSADHRAMAPHWKLTRDILGGVETMRAGGKAYLPKLPAEDEETYRYRLSLGKFTNVYRDVVENLAAKPFSQEVAVSADAPDRIRALCEDIDASGNNLHVFASRLLFSGINDGLSWILVDFTRVRKPLNKAEAKALNVRPYWVHIEAPDVLGVEWAMVDGQHQIVTARIAEYAIETEGFEERIVERILLLVRDKLDDGGYAPARFEIFEKQRKIANGEMTWVSVDGGPMTLGVVPLVPFVAGRRTGACRYVPPLADIAHLQVELYQAETAHKYAMTMTSFPMLVAKGMAPPDPVTLSNGSTTPGPAIATGPGRVLFAPGADGIQTSWEYLEPNGESLKHLADGCDRIEAQIRELGRQPFTAASGNLTVVSTAFMAAKANSVIESWSLNLKDALEQALKLTAKWLQIDAEPEVAMATDFSGDVLGETGSETLLKMRATGDLSQRTLWAEIKRRGVLRPEFDPDAELELILEEVPGDDLPEDIAAASVIPFRKAQ